MRTASVFLIAVWACQAGNYYVSPTGSDSNPGSVHAPWATLQHAVDSIQPGDTILVQSGTYVGCRIENPGTQHKPKTLKAAPNAHVVLNAPGPGNWHNSILEIENFAFRMTDWVIDGLEVANSPKYGIDVRVTDRITVTNNRVHDSALTGIFTAFSDHVLIEGNESYKNGEHGIYQSNSSMYPVIRSNNVHHNGSAGIHMNGDLTQGPPGIIQFATVEFNTIVENGVNGGAAINGDGVDDSVIRFNILTNNHATGIALYAIEAAHGSSRNQVTHNTVVMAKNSRDAFQAPDWGLSPAPVGNEVEFNILCTPDSFNNSVMVAGPHVPGFSSDHNVVSNQFSDDNGNTTIPLSQWQKLGYDTHSLLACAPLLTPDKR